MLVAVRLLLSVKGGGAGEHTLPRPGGTQREQTDERRNDDQDLDHANSVPQRYETSLERRMRDEDRS